MYFDSNRKLIKVKKDDAAKDAAEKDKENADGDDKAEKDDEDKDLGGIIYKLIAIAINRIIICDYITHYILIISKYDIKFNKMLSIQHFIKF